MTQSQNQTNISQALATVEADSSDGKQDGKQDALVETDSISEESGSGPGYNPCSSLLFHTCRDGF